jgi:hypothetical protein
LNIQILFLANCRTIINMPFIHISNVSSHAQTFEVHGFNNNQNVTVNAKSTHSINEPSRTQHNGAIIALHQGHEGEQAEITFNGWGDMETYDISVIVGAGGNLTIEQSGAPNTRKGDPTFMQDLRSHYAKADAKTKESLKNCLHLDSHGQVIRMDAPKNFPLLESFVRTFAERKVYIGIGAWQGNKGDAGDNAQSSGTKGGNKDVQIVYSDADTPAGTHAAFVFQHEAVQTAHRAPATGEQKTETAANGPSEQKPGTEAATLGTASTASTVVPVVGEGPLVKAAASPFAGDPDHGGPGVTVANKSTREETYFFFNNYWNGNGTAGANFDRPDRSIALRPHTNAFIGLPASFKGRVQRGKFIPATWVEFQLDASNRTGAWGDISLEQGYDGPAMIRSLDGHNQANGFAHDILPGAPAAATTIRAQDKVKVLASTMGNAGGGPNHAAIEYEKKVVGQKKAYITGGQGTDMVNSKNKRMAVEFY